MVIHASPLSLVSLLHVPSDILHLAASVLHGPHAVSLVISPPRPTSLSDTQGTRTENRDPRIKAQPQKPVYHTTPTLVPCGYALKALPRWRKKALAALRLQRRSGRRGPVCSFASIWRYRRLWDMVAGEVDVGR